MKIRVKAFPTLRQVMGDQGSLEIEAEHLTIRDLLEKLSVKFGKAFANMIFDPETRSGSRHVHILLNGRNCRHLPDRLDTELKEGDEVSLFPLMAGG